MKRATVYFEFDSIANRFKSVALPSGSSRWSGVPRIEAREIFYETWGLFWKLPFGIKDPGKGHASGSVSW